MDPDGEDATAVDWNVHCNADCDSNWKGVWDVDSQKDSEYNWHGECDANCEGNRGDDWEGDWEGNWAIDCNNDVNCDWDSKWNGGWDTDEENNCGTNCDGDCDIDNDADGDGERKGNNDNHSVGDGVGCGRIDSDGKDLSAAVGEDTGGVADTGAINAKDKKNFTNEMLSSTFFFHTVFYITFKIQFIFIGIIKFNFISKIVFMHLTYDSLTRIRRQIIESLSLFTLSVDK